MSGLVRPLAAAAAVCLSVLAGCSDSAVPAASSSAPTGKASASPSPSASSSASAQPTPTGPLPRLPKGQGALADVVAQQCSVVDGKWLFTATLRNTGKAPFAYAVGVTISNRNDSAPVARKVETVKVAPRTSAKVSIDTLGSFDPAGHVCVVQVVKNPAK